VVLVSGSVADVAAYAVTVLIAPLFFLRFTTRDFLAAGT